MHYVQLPYDVWGAPSVSLSHTHTHNMNERMHTKQNVSIWRDQFRDSVVFACFNSYAFEPASWQITVETENDIMEGYTTEVPRV